MAPDRQINPALAQSAAESIYDGLAILGGLTVYDAESKKNVMLVKSRLADALIDLHNSGVACPKPLPHDPLAKRTSRASG